MEARQQLVRAALSAAAARTAREAESSVVARRGGGAFWLLPPCNNVVVGVRVVVEAVQLIGMAVRLGKGRVLDWPCWL